MNRIYRTFILLLLFLSLFSCTPKDDFDYKGLYEKREYEKILEHASIVNSNHIEEDALYYKSLCLYVMGDMEGAFNSSYLYTLLFDEKSDYYRDANKIVLHSADKSDDEIALESYEYLRDTDQLSKNNKIVSYQRLVRQGEKEEADRLYLELKNLLTTYEETLMHITAENDSERIVNSLFSLYEEKGLSEDFISAMKLAIPLFINRNEGSSLMPLVNKGNLGDDSYSMLIGDLMYSLGNTSMARFYWKQASDSFPDEIEIRMRDEEYYHFL